MSCLTHIVKWLPTIISLVTSIISYRYKIKEKKFGNSLVVQWLGLGGFTPGAWLWSLVGELRYHKPHDAAKKKKKKFFSLVMGTLSIYCLNNFPMYHTAVLTTVIMLYIISLVLIYFIIGGLYLLIPFIQFPFSLPPTPVTTNLISFSMSLVFVFSDSTYKCDHAGFVFHVA